MSSVDLSTSEHDGLAVAALRGELDVMGAAAVAAELRVVASGGRVVIADLAGLESIDSAAWAPWYTCAVTPARAEATCCSPRHSGRCCGAWPSPS